ncbi:hypothetical protein [Microbacterium sp. NPDC077486]|uniref:hypothetical protein n=1 Tax=Microbacterium sp. NPDC077486 TaxID=3154766 RepID=UPI0034343085
MTGQQQSTSLETIWVPGHPGWEGQQRATTALTVFGVVFAIVVLLFSLILFADPAPAMKALGIGVLAAVAVGVWLMVAHARVSRVRVVRPVVDGPAIAFGGAAGIVWPLRALAPVGALLLAAWAWSIFTVPADRLPLLTLLLLPVVALIMTIAGIRSWFRAPSAHRLTLRPDGLQLRIPRNNVAVAWEEVVSAGVEGNRVVLRTSTAQPSSWAAADLASDPVLLAELVTFYANRPDVRAEIGAGTLARLRSGEF